jgi:KDO2-lipid IV(A) lauroyltransferase
MLNYFRYAPFYLISLFPFWVIYRISSFAYFLIFHVIGYRKKVVFQNLKNSFPNKSEKELNIIAQKFYHHFCEIFLESIKLLTVSSKNIQKRFLFKNPELFETLFQEKKGVILYAAHFGNWEWMTCFPLYSSYKFMSFYQKQSNRYFDKFMVHLRGRFGNTSVESQSGFKELMQRTKQGNLTITYVVGDQSPMHNSSMHWTDFLNQDTAFLVGADRMAKKCNQVLIFPFITQPKRGFYELEFKPIPMNDPKKTIDYYAKFLEENIKKQPELWLWSHRRWKRKRD